MPVLRLERLVLDLHEEFVDGLEVGDLQIYRLYERQEERVLRREERFDLSHYLIPSLQRVRDLSNIRQLHALAVLTQAHQWLEEPDLLFL